MVGNFFTERSHQTRVNASLSDANALYSAVVQGSGMRPVAFLIYVDDLAEVLLQYGVRVKIFTDDVKVYVEISHDYSTVNELQTVLDVIYAWATEWQLQVSVEKCAILKIGNVSDNNDYYKKIFNCQMSCLAVTSVSL